MSGFGDTGSTSDRPQTWRSGDKRVTLGDPNGRIQTYSEVDTRTGRVTTTTFIKTGR